MISKNLLKELSTYRQSKRCDEEGVFVVEGVKMCGEALASGWTIKKVCATARWMEENAMRLSSIEHYTVGEADLARMSAMQQPNEVWMLVERRPMAASYDGVTLVLDHLQDPGNLGTILRTADWMGLRTIVCSTGTVSCYNPKVVQASMGAVFRTAVVYAELQQWMADYEHPVYGTLLGGDDIYSAEIEQPCAIVVGNESRGVSDEVRQRITQAIAIPNYGGTCESLNASVATAIVLAEIRRRENIENQRTN